MKNYELPIPLGFTMPTTDGPSQPAVAVASSAARQPGSLPANLVPLVYALRTFRHPAPHWPDIGNLVARFRPRVYGDGGFKAYMHEAAKQGIVEIGNVEGKETLHWARLTPAMRDYQLPVPLGFNLTESEVGPRLASVSAASTAASESGSVPAKLFPLVAAIRSQPTPTPHWTSVSTILKRVQPRVLGGVGLKPYLAAAVKAGVIEVGEFEGQKGKHWMMFTPAMANYELPSPLGYTMPDFVDVSGSTSSPAAPPVPTREDGSFQLKFLPLVQTIRSFRSSAPHWPDLRAVLNRVQPPVYEAGAFKAYMEEAVEEGLIEVGAVGGEDDVQWAKLAPSMLNYRLPTPLGYEVPLPAGAAAIASVPAPPARSIRSLPQRAASSTSFSVAFSSENALIAVAASAPPRFLPLLRAIDSVPFPRPYWSQISLELGKQGLRPYGEEGFRGYVEEAVRLGLVETGKGEKTGQDWLAIKSGVKLSDDLDLPTPPAVRPPQPGSALRPPSTSSFAVFPPLPTATPSPNLSAPLTSSLPDLDRPPVISTPCGTNLGGTASSFLPIPESDLARWRPLAPLRPFAPLILTLRYLRQHNIATPSLAQVRQVLERFPAEALPSTSDGSNMALDKIIEHGGGPGASGEGLFGYLSRASRAGVVSVGDEGISLKKEWMQERW
ncbi:hypothetical protein JCM8097_001063 [Rhodosporidiobolus ruineniae]